MIPTMILFQLILMEGKFPEKKLANIFVVPKNYGEPGVTFSKGHFVPLHDEIIQSSFEIIARKPR